jgi:hypothetical protein
MLERGAIIAFLLGVGGFCALEVVSGHHVALIGGLLAFAFVAFGVATSFRASRHRRLVRGLWSASSPTLLAGMSVRTGDISDAAFVAGLGRPTIFCDRHLPEHLSASQLEAVLLHERAHQRAWDPARLLLVEIAAPALGLAPVGRAWLAWLLAQREIAADRYAMAHGATRADLAGALLQVPPLAQAHVAGFASAVDLRLRALLGDQPQPVVPRVIRRATTVLSGAAVGTAACVWFLDRLLVTSVLPCC